MSKKDSNEQFAREQLQQLLETVPYKHHFRIHRIHHVHVNRFWHIERYRKNQDLHMLWVKGGRGIYDLDGKKEDLHAGKLIFVSHDYPHAAHPDPDRLPWIIPVRFGLYEHVSGQMVKPFEHPFSFTFVPKRTASFQQHFERLHHYHASKDMVGRQEACGALLHQIFIELLNEASVSGADPRVSKVKQMLDESPNHQLTIHDMAAWAGLSNKQFTRLFVRQYGVTPKQYQIAALIRRANFFLEDTSLTIAQIAAELGYPDPYTFSKQYKKFTGNAPSENRGG